jgi:class 3 adenylate cyclase
VVYCLELRFGVGTRMVVVGVGGSGGYTFAWWNFALWIS